MNKGFSKRALKAHIRELIECAETQADYEDVGAYILNCELQGYLTFNESFDYIMILSGQLLEAREAGVL